MKIYEAWEELTEWLKDQKAFGFSISPEIVLGKIDELEMKHE